MSDSGIFKAAVKLPADERAAYVDQACGDNVALRQEVESLLQAHEAPGSFLGSLGSGRGMTEGFHPLTDRPGTQIGPYKLLQQIGEGGMGVVWMAEQTQPVQRKVALKVIKPGMDSRQVIARFEAERQALAMMDHVNIARVLDAGTTESGLPYFVMELVHGVPITQYCDDIHLTPRERLELFVPVCQAIQHAHQKGIIHRDIKPSNVMVTLYDGKPVPKVIDFGVAKATEQTLTERTLFTQYGTMVGTLEYMSPEQAEMSALGVDTRSDIFSLGVLLYELLTGSTPLTHKRLKDAAYGEILRMIREEEPPKPSTRLTESGEAMASISAQRQMEPAKLTKLVRGELDWIVMKTLEKDRNRRYETANGLARDIEHYLCDEPVHACPPTRTYRLKKFIRRNKAAALTGSAVVAALTAGLVLASIGFLQARRQAQIAAAEAAKANAISELLQSALQSANPDQAKGSAYTVRALLDDIAADLGDKLADQPEVEIELRTTIGLAYRRLGISRPAEPQFKRALELARRIYGPEHDKVAAVLVGYGKNLAEQSHTVDAEKVLREAVRIYHLNAISGKPLVNALWALEIVLVTEHRPAAAEAVAREALAVAESSGTEYPEVASVLHMLANIKVDQKEYAVAEDLARRAVEMHRRLHGNENLETGWGLTYLGRALASNAKYPEAEASYREALAIFRRYYDGSHRSVGAAVSGVKSALLAQGDTAGVEVLEREQSEWILNAGQGAKLDPTQWLQLGRIAKGYGKLDVAERYFRECAGSLEGLIGTRADQYENRLDLNDCYIGLNEVLDRSNKTEAATEAIHKAIAVLDRAIVDYPKNRQKFLQPQAHNYRYLSSRLSSQRSYAAAREASSASTGFFRESAKSSNTLSETAFCEQGEADNFQRIGDHWKAEGRSAEAHEAYRQALAVQERIEEQDYTQYINADWIADHYDDLSGLLVQVGTPKDALRIAHVLRPPRVKMSQRHWRSLLCCHLQLGLLLQKGGNSDEASQQFERMDQVAGEMVGSPKSAAGDWQQFRESVHFLTAAATAAKQDTQLAEAQRTALVEKLTSRTKKVLADYVKHYRAMADKGDVDAHNHLAEAYASGQGVAQDADEAIAEYTKAIGLKPDGWEAWSGRAFVYFRQEQWDKAAADFGNVVEHRPDGAEGWYWRGAAFAQLNQPDKAVADLQQAIAKGFNNVEQMTKDPKLNPLRTREDFGTLLGELHKKAITDHSKAIELGDQDANQRLRRAYSYQALGDLHHAKDDCSKAVELEPKNWRCWHARAEIYAKLGESDKARADLDNAVEFCANNPGEQNELAWELAADPSSLLFSPKVAAELAKKAVAADPRAGEIWNTLGVAQYRAGNWQGAATALNKSVELRDGGDSSDWFFLAMGHWQLNEKEDARAWYDKAVAWMDKNEPKNEELLRFRREAEELLNVKK